MLLQKHVVTLLHQTQQCAVITTADTVIRLVHVVDFVHIFNFFFPSKFKVNLINYCNCAPLV